VCGIVGFMASGRMDAEAARRDVLRMASAVVHRGPDDEGVWIDSTAGIALGHRRLAVIDVSPLGHQPMVSASGRYVITFNGEIYNFKDLRTQLDSANEHPPKKR